MKRPTVLGVALLIQLLPVAPAEAQLQPESISPNPYLIGTSVTEHFALDQRPGPTISTHGLGVAGVLNGYSADPVLGTPLPAAETLAEASAGALPVPKWGPWVRVTKWLTLGSGAGLAGLGFAINNDADDSFRELTLHCNATPEVCQLNRDGSYADPALEAEYQDILHKDRRARLSLIAGEVSLVVSLGLFVLDFEHGGGPEDVPYEPEDEKSELQLTVVPGELAVRYYFR